MFASPGNFIPCSICCYECLASQLVNVEGSVSIGINLEGILYCISLEVYNVIVTHYGVFTWTLCWVSVPPSGAIVDVMYKSSSLSCVWFPL